MRHTLFVVFALLCLQQSVGAEPTCVALKSTDAYGTYRGKIPAGFKLVCPGATLMGADENEYVYRFTGSKMMSGTLIYQEVDEVPDGEGGGEPISFIPNSPSYLPTGVTRFHLVDHVENAKLNGPRRRGKQPACWQAPATILVNGIALINDGTDESGDFARPYKIATTGAFSRCRK